MNIQELERLERAAKAAFQLALALGQDATLLEQIEKREVHPAMAGFGLWKNDESLEGLGEDVYQARLEASSRSEAGL